MLTLRQASSGTQTRDPADRGKNSIEHYSSVPLPFYSLPPFVIQLSTPHLASR